MTVRLDLAAIKNLTDQAAEQGLRAALGKAEEILKGDILSSPGSGRIYRRGGVSHQASAPGEAPAPDTGFLRSNTNADPALQDDGRDLTGQIVAAAAYASAQERGTERMAARPYLSTLRDEHSDELTGAFVEGARQSQ